MYMIHNLPCLSWFGITQFYPHSPRLFCWHCRNIWLHQRQWSILEEYPNSKVHVAYMGPTWGRQDPGGHHVGPMNLANRVWVKYYTNSLRTLYQWLNTRMWQLVLLLSCTKPCNNHKEPSTTKCDMSISHQIYFMYVKYYDFVVLDWCPELFLPQIHTSAPAFPATCPDSCDFWHCLCCRIASNEVSSPKAARHAHCLEAIDHSITILGEKSPVRSI